MATQNSDKVNGGEKEAWVKPQIVDLDKGMDSVRGATGAASDSFGASTATS